MKMHDFDSLTDSENEKKEPKSCWKYWQFFGGRNVCTIFIKPDWIAVPIINEFKYVRLLLALMVPNHSTTKMFVLLQPSYLRKLQLC